MGMLLTGLQGDDTFSRFQRCARKVLKPPPGCCENQTLLFRVAWGHGLGAWRSAGQVRCYGNQVEAGSVWNSFGGCSCHGRWPLVHVVMEVRW
jgi:hypothetical protein